MLDRLKVLNDNTDGRNGQPESDSGQHKCLCDGCAKPCFKLKKMLLF